MIFKQSLEKLLYLSRHLVAMPLRLFQNGQPVNQTFMLATLTHPCPCSLWTAMAMLSKAKRKDVLPDPAKINPLLSKRASENANKTETAEPVTRAVDRPSLILKGQTPAEVVLTVPPPHRLVKQKFDVGTYTGRAAESKGSDRGSEASPLQFSVPTPHNPDDVMVIPADYDSRELVELPLLVRQSCNVGLTWRPPVVVLVPPMRWR